MEKKPSDNIQARYIKYAGNFLITAGIISFIFASIQYNVASQEKNHLETYYVKSGDTRDPSVVDNLQRKIATFEGFIPITLAYAAIFFILGYLLLGRKGSYKALQMLLVVIALSLVALALNVGYLIDLSLIALAGISMLAFCLLYKVGKM